MFKRITGKRQKKDAIANTMLSLELTEVEEIAERLFLSIEKKVRDLRTVEERLDKKIGFLEALLSRADLTGASSDDRADLRHREIFVLHEKGLKIEEISSILDMPRGEVELIMGLGR
ncbi:MAG: hypothetical protein HZA17_01665 [Nitrospirae bacterium]|nr:hypothetical protein [Nitrospirota bacterium]